MKSSSLLTSVARGVIWSVVIPLFLLYAFSVRAQTYIFGRADFPVGTGVIAVAAGDFNGDGVLDMAVVNEADNTVSVLLGKSDGTFAPQVTYATGLGPLAITTGDFNGDGNLDLAVTDANCIPYKFGLNCDVRTVSILLGNGDGSFRPHIDYATGTQPSSVAAGDFNGDGKLDLAVTNEQDGTVSVLLGNGDGTFQTQVVYPIANGAQSVIVADFNGDHKLDLAVGGSQFRSCWAMAMALFRNRWFPQEPRPWPWRILMAIASWTCTRAVTYFLAMATALLCSTPLIRMPPLPPWLTSMETESRISCSHNVAESTLQTGTLSRSFWGTEMEHFRRQCSMVQRHSPPR